MARETRGGHRDTPINPPASASTSTPPATASGSAAATPNKRKRRTSSTSTPNASANGPSIKLMLPAGARQASTSPEKQLVEDVAPRPADVNGTNGAKRQKISLKIKSAGGTREMSKSPVPETVVEEQDEHPAAEAEASVPRALSKEVRGALVIVIAQMAINLPPPLNNVMTLSLPPGFETTEDNTLGYKLNKPSLTWANLVELLHTFSENLLVPCQYPNPFPSFAQIHQPVPALPSHYRPHVIFNFCKGLHSLMLQIEPSSTKLDATSAEKWALMQKIPLPSAGHTIQGEWWTSAVDMQVSEAILRGMPKDEEDGADETLLSKLAARGDRFGLAVPVSLQTMGNDEKKVVKLGSSVIQKASLKMQRWKEIKEARKRGGFGSIVRGVTAVNQESGWTPTFAPTYDSMKATGGASYYSTLDAMRERWRTNAWRRSALDGRLMPEFDKGWRGTIEADTPSQENGEQTANGRSVEDILSENQAIIRELEAWQDNRTRKGLDHPRSSSREQALADVLLASLSDLSSNVKPSDLAPSGAGDGAAHELAQRFIPVSSPSIRGTLDPRRPQAIHDNMTIRPRSAAQLSQMGTNSTINNLNSLGGLNQMGGSITSTATPNRNYTPPAATSGPAGTYRYTSGASAYTASKPNAYRPPNTPNYASPHNSPSSMYGRNGPLAGLNAGGSPSPVNGSSGPMTPGLQQQQHHSQHQQHQQPQHQLPRPGPGPSGLRQAYGPPGPQAPGSPYGRNPAAGLMSQVGPAYRG